MPKSKQRKSARLAGYVEKYPVFKTDGQVLYCKVCNKQVSAKKIYSIKSHLESATHKEQERKSTSSTQQFLVETASSGNAQFTVDLCKAFIASDIPLYKIRNDNLKSFFQKYIGNYVIPSETTLRTAVKSIYTTSIEKIKTCIKKQYVWISIDETTDASGRYIANVVLGILNKDPEISKQRFLLNTALLNKANHTNIARLFDDSIRILGETFNKDDVLLLLTDAAPYMVKAAKALQVFYPKLLHVTCLAHALHRVCEKITESNPKIDGLIANVKKVFLKAPSRAALFRDCAPDIPFPPQPIITRWGTWLEAVGYYAKHFENIQSVVAALDSDDSQFVKRARELLNDAEVRQKLLFVDASFGFLVNSIKKLESAGLLLTTQIQLVKEVEEAIDKGQCTEIKQKLISVLLKNKGFIEIKKIADQIEGKKVNSPCHNATYTISETQAFKYAPITSVDVERTFSMYKSLYRENRHSFLFNNLAEIFVVYCNNNLN